MTTPIAILGTGRMGSALAGNFLERGHPLRVWNRTPTRAEPLTARGARLAASVADAVRDAELVIGILLDYGTTSALLSTPEVLAAMRGKLLVQLASGSPSQARASARWASERDIRYLDGAIMATPAQIGRPESMIVYAGERALYDAHAPALSPLSGSSVYVGSDVGHASALDAALLSYMWGILFGAVQGAAISRAEGLSLEAFHGYVKALQPTVADFSLEVVERVQRSRFDDTQASLETHHAALQHVLEICRERKLDGAVPEAFDRLFRAGRARGFDQLDFSALIEVVAAAH